MVGYSLASANGRLAQSGNRWACVQRYPYLLGRKQVVARRWISANTTLQFSGRVPGSNPGCHSRVGCLTAVLVCGMLCIEVALRFTNDERLYMSHDLSHLEFTLPEVSDFAMRTLMPSPGDLFDIVYSLEYAERYIFISSEEVVALYRIEDSNMIPYSDIDVLTWNEITGAVGESRTPETAFLVILTTHLTEPTPLAKSLNTIRDTAMSSPNSEETIHLLNMEERLRNG